MVENKREDKEEKEKPEQRPYQHYEATILHKVHHVYFSEPFEDPSHYVDIIHKMKTAGPEDVFNIYLNSRGGYLNTGAQIINAIQATPAYVVASIEAEAHSLATLIFLAADEFTVHDNCTMMFHAYSGGVGGKEHEQVAQLEATRTWFRTLSRKLWIPFLDEEEYDRIIRGEDIWMQSDEIRQRLDNMVAILKKQREEKEKQEDQEKQKEEKQSSTRRSTRKKTTS